MLHTYVNVKLTGEPISGPINAKYRLLNSVPLLTWLKCHIKMTDYFYI